MLHSLIPKVFFRKVERVGGYPGGLGELGQHCEQVYVGVCQHACPEVGVLRLGAIVVGKDMAQWTVLGVAYQRAVLDAVPDEKV